MGRTWGVVFGLCPAKLIENPETKMAYSYTYSSYSGYPSALQDRFPTIDVITDGYRRNCRAKSEMTEIMMDSLKTERGRFYREFLNDKPNGSGFYYPRYESNWSLEHGSPHATSHSNQSTESLIRNIEQAIAQEFTGQEAEIVDIDPCEEQYPGIDEITRQYESWEWVFGKSPKFTFDLGQDDLNISVVNGIMKLPDEEIKLTKEAIQYLKTSPYTLLWNKL